jgi:hypothetical protein
VLRDVSESKGIEDAMLRARKQEVTVPTDSGPMPTTFLSPPDHVIDISSDYEALPHPGQSALSPGAHTTGVVAYSLWRKGGGRELPSADTTPKGVSRRRWLFQPGKDPAPE